MSDVESDERSTDEDSGSSLRDFIVADSDTHSESEEEESQSQVTIATSQTASEDLESMDVGTIQETFRTENGCRRSTRLRRPTQTYEGEFWSEEEADLILRQVDEDELDTGVSSDEHSNEEDSDESFEDHHESTSESASESESESESELLEPPLKQRRIEQ